MQFDYSTNPQYPSIPKSVHLRSDGNVQYLQMIDFIKYLWEKGHPDVRMVPSAPISTANPDLGYIVYGLESRATQKDYAKARLIEVINEDDKIYEVWMQSFDNFISFASVHSNPRVSEEIIEAFEDFMIESTPVLKQVGVGELLYSRRYPDREDARIARDMCVRTVVYRAFLQKVRKIEREALQSICIEARVWWDKHIQEIPTEEETVTVSAVIKDSYQQATPNT